MEYYFSKIAFKIARQGLGRSHSWSKIEIIEVRLLYNNNIIIIICLFASNTNRLHGYST